MKSQKAQEKSQKAQEPTAPIVLQSGELETHLETTKERLSLAATQLAELASLLLAPDPPAPASDLPVPVEERALTYVIVKAQGAERELSEARDLPPLRSAPDSKEGAKVPSDKDSGVGRRTQSPSSQTK
jgi:hypothetical protein